MSSDRILSAAPTNPLFIPIMKKGKEVVERPVHQFTRGIGVTPAPTRGAGRQGCISRVNNNHEGGRTHHLPRRATNARISATSAAFYRGWWAPPNILGFFLGVDDRRVSPFPNQTRIHCAAVIFRFPNTAFHKVQSGTNFTLQHPRSYSALGMNAPQNMHPGSNGSMRRSAAPGKEERTSAATRR
ncbi:hypothetical protein M752DRAFT_330386 [Aspergillus phoenicis ATCC 13157]|uniref:Uncharacterized protein n=1 Tax=Aspergillus phoenicis ATCC 13157 TaxID=1353007 RepID=A0A370P6X4_ASPPH|nr:hypothetical protein M752DRAFT_330386 [Aspergillus phoenicis ATCC 13157]